MAKKTRTRRKAPGKETAVNVADATGVYTRPEDAAKDLATDEREKFLRKQARDQKKVDKGNEVKDYHYELNGLKLIKKVRKANGNVYSFYVTNIKSNPGILDDPDVKQNLKR